MYGLDWINWKTATLKQLSVFQNHIMRYILNKRQQEHIAITELLAKTKLHSISSIAKSQTLKLYDHVKPSKAGISKICIEGKVMEK